MKRTVATLQFADNNGHMYFVEGVILDDVDGVIRLSAYYRRTIDAEVAVAESCKRCGMPLAGDGSCSQYEHSENEDRKATPAEAREGLLATFGKPSAEEADALRDALRLDDKLDAVIGALNMAADTTKGDEQC